MSILKNLRALALLAGVASVAACVPVVAYPPSEGETQSLSIGEGVAHVNRAADPTLAAPSYPNCYSEQFHVHADADQNGKTFDTAAGQNCPGVQIRGGTAPKPGEPGV